MTIKQNRWLNLIYFSYLNLSGHVQPKIYIRHSWILTINLLRTKRSRQRYIRSVSKMIIQASWNRDLKSSIIKAKGIIWMKVCSNLKTILKEKA